MPKISKSNKPESGGQYTALELLLALDVQDCGDERVEGAARTLLSTRRGRAAGAAVARVDLRAEQCEHINAAARPVRRRDMMTSDGRPPDAIIGQPPETALRTPVWSNVNGKAILCPFPTRPLRVRPGSVWMSPIDQWTAMDGVADGLHRPTFKAFHWRAHGAEAKELSPPTALNEALLVVTAGEVDVWSDGQRPTRIAGDDGSFGVAWIGNASATPWLPRTHLQVVGEGEAHGLLFVIGEAGVPYESVSGVPADGIRLAPARKTETPTFNKDNLGHGWRPTRFDLSRRPGLAGWNEQLRRLSADDLEGYPHERGVEFGNIWPGEVKGWRRLREGGNPRQPRLLFRIIQFPEQRKDSQIGMATHAGVEALVALSGGIDAYMCPLDAKDRGALQLAELRRDKAHYERVHLAAASDGRPAVLMLRPSHMHHAVVACGQEAFALLVGASNLEWKSGWVDLSQLEDEQRGHGAKSRA